MLCGGLSSQSHLKSIIVYSYMNCKVEIKYYQTNLQVINNNLMVVQHSRLSRVNFDHPIQPHVFMTFRVKSVMQAYCRLQFICRCLLLSQYLNWLGSVTVGLLACRNASSMFRLFQDSV